MAFVFEVPLSSAFKVAYKDCPRSCETVLCQMLRLVVRLSLNVNGLCVAKKMHFSVLTFCSVDLIF